MVRTAGGCDPCPVDPSDDHSPGRRPLLLPVLIAAVFLAVIGAAAGLVLGSRAAHRGDTGPTTAAVAPTAATPSSATPSALPAPSGGDGTGPDGPACRRETQRQARAAGADGVLRPRLKVRTAHSTVWVCQDEVGRLFYHANRGGDDAAWVEGQTALFLTDVEPADDGFQAMSADGRGGQTVFFVSAERLLILHANGRKEEQPALGG